MAHVEKVWGRSGNRWRVRLARRARFGGTETGPAGVDVALRASVVGQMERTPTNQEFEDGSLVRRSPIARALGWMDRIPDETFAEAMRPMTPEEVEEEFGADTP